MTFTNKELIKAAKSSLNKWTAIKRSILPLHHNSLACGFCDLLEKHRIRRGNPGICKKFCPANDICDDNSMYWVKPESGERNISKDGRRLDANIVWLENYIKELTP